jgi:fructose transport system ATP-binding protein
LPRRPTASTSTALGRRLAVIEPKKYTMSGAVALMTGALEAPAEERVH